MKLYELVDQLERALADPTIMDPETGELLDSGRLDGLQMALDQKVLNVALYILGEDREAEAVQVEIERLQRRRSAHVNRSRRLRDYLADCCAKGDKFKDSRCTVTIGESVSVDVVDGEMVPHNFKVQPPQPAMRVDKAAALVALKAGKEIPGLALLGKPKVTIR